MTDNAEDIDHVFTVKGISDYAGGLAVFMDIDSMRELFGQEEDYCNMLLSDKELNIDEGRIYSITTKEEAEHSASIFTSLMMPLVILMTVAAGAILKNGGVKIVILEGGSIMDYRIEHRERQQFIALVRAFSNETSNDDNDHSIPDFWTECSEKTH